MADIPNSSKDNATAVKSRYSFFLGCVMPVKMPWGESAIMHTLPELGVDLEYLKKGTCCPRAGVWKSVDERVWLTLASYNLLQAEGDGRDVLVSCNGCYVTLYEANQLLKENPEKLKQVNEYLAEAHSHYNASIRVRHLLEVLYEEVGLDRIRRESRKVPIRVAIHPGCHMRIFDDGRLVRYFSELTGILVDEVVPYEEEQMCCGLQANLADRHFATYERAKKKFDAIKALNVDALVIVCSGCYDQFERALQILKKEIGYEFGIPIIHLAELLALSRGIDPGDFGMRYLRTAPVDAIIAKWESDRR
jgi:heterodisulfide reductase subunit B